MVFELMLRPEKYGSVRLTKTNYDHHWMAIKHWLAEDRPGFYRRCYHHCHKSKNTNIAEVEYIFSDPHVAFEFKMRFC